MVVHPVIVAVSNNLPERTPKQVAAQREAAARALAQSATLVGAPSGGWAQDSQGVPMAQGEFHWSMAHKRGYAAAVVADLPVGIDIEQVRPRHDDSLAEVADAEEWSLFGERSWVHFFRIWTAKEAVLKAIGVGIGGLPRCRVVDVVDVHRLVVRYESGDWRVAQFSHDGHIAAVTVGDGLVEWHVEP